MNAALIGVVLLCLTPVFRHMPLNALAAIVITGVIGLLDFPRVLFLLKVSAWLQSSWLLGKAPRCPQMQCVMLWSSAGFLAGRACRHQGTQSSAEAQNLACGSHPACCLSLLLAFCRLPVAVLLQPTHA